MELRPRYRFGLCLAVLVALALCGSPSFGQITGTNVNMVSGVEWPGGDPFLQRQNEPSIAVSSRNPFHLLAGANDYRSVDLALTTNGETGDAWLGLFKSLDGGNTWRSILLPGCPYNTSVCAGAPAVKNAGYQAAADPTVRAGTNGMFYYAGLVFNRGLNPPSAIIVSRLIDLNNKENADPNDILNGDSIQYVSTAIAATGTPSQFLDKPSMAVDIPRSGAGTCNLSVNQPGNGLVNQSFPAGNVYVAYTAFTEPPNSDPTTLSNPQSKIYFVRSKDCGATWSTPIAISGSGAINQGVTIAINPLNGTVYVAWRQFNYQLGNISQPDAIEAVVSTNWGENFSHPMQVSTFTPFDEGTTQTSFRTNAYPSAASDASGRVYLAYSARNVVPSGDARIVVTSSSSGSFWNTPVIADNPAVDPVNNPSGRGHQIMPAIIFAAGKLSLLYYDLRLDHTYGLFSPLLLQGVPTGRYGEMPVPVGELGLSPPDLNSVFNQFIDDSTTTLRRHTFDLRIAQALPADKPVFSSSVLVSQYAYGCCASNQTDIQQLQFNAPNLPMFRSGTAPFMGDYVDLAAGPSFLPPTAPSQNDGIDRDTDDWQYNLSSSTPTVLHASWTDNRDVQAPPNGDWKQYTPPLSPSLGTTSIFEPGTSVPACQAGFTGSRNQNIYTAPVNNGLVFGAPINTKQLGTTVFNGKTVLFQRAFAVVAQNTTNVVKSFRLTIVNQPAGGNASFLQFAQLTTLDLSIPAVSSATRPVFVTSTNLNASITINIAEITAPQGTLVPNGLTSSTALNPDPTNPAITNPAITNPAITNPAITNFEVYNPAITNPAITNPAITNPAITNPAITNPAITNSTFQNTSVVNPAITNPAPNAPIANPAITNPNVANPAITNPAITNVNPANTSVADTQWTVSNTGNTEGSFAVKLVSSDTNPAGNVLQLIISKLYQTPATPSGMSCDLEVETHNVVVTNIVSKNNQGVLLSPTDPAITNPAITNPAITNATVALAPGETANIILRVVNTNTAVYPTFNPAASVAPVVVSQSVNTQTALSIPPGGTPPPPPVTVPPLQITTASLPNTASGSVYAAGIQTVGGNPTSHTFSITSGALPSGLTLGATTGTISGLVTATGPATFTFTVQVQDIGSTTFPQHTATQNLSINVSGTGPAITNLTPAPLLAPATPGVVFPGNFVISGQNLQGAIVTTDGPLLLTGAPVVNAAGTSLSQGYSIACCVPLQGQVFHLFVNTPVGSATVTDTIALSSQVPGNVTFLTEPTNSIGGQTLSGSPVVVQVTDTSGAAIAGIDVTMSFNGTPPCSAAVLSGTLSQVTNSIGQASFPDLSIDRGQLGYTLSASIGNVSSASNPFTVNGFCSTGSMATARALLNGVTLLNGKVLIAGGAPAFSNQSVAFSSAELYDPVTHSFTAVGSMHSPRSSINMALLQNGLVLVAGGLNGSAFVSSAELFDPSTNTFTLLPNSMVTARGAGTATMLGDGRVLITGGNGGTVLAAAEIFDPATNTFTPTSHPMTSARFLHEAILLPDGKVLITGGFAAFGPNGPINPLASAELYDPVTDTFTPTGSMAAARYEHASALMSTGKVLVYGGFTANSFTVPLATAEIYDPLTGTFTPTATAPQTGAGFLAPVPVLADGTVFLYGGANAQIYDPALATFRVTATTAASQAQPVTSLLNDGTILVTGGVGSPTFDAGIATAQIYYSTAPLAPVAITTTSLANAATGQAYTQILLEQGGVGNLTWTESGALPAGLTFTNQGILIGTPTIAGTFPLTVTLTDSSTPAKTVSANFTLTVANTPLTFTSPMLPTAVAGKPYTQTLPVIGGTQPYSASLTPTSGPLPTGLNLAGNVLTGTPSGTGNFTFTVIVTDSSTPAQTATQTLTIAVNTLAITTTTLPNGIVRVPYNAAISTNGGILPLSFSGATPAFPPGLAILPPSPGSASGALAGTPTRAGTFFFSETVADSSTPAQTATQNYVVTIAPVGSLVPANVTFVSQPQNSVGGQTLSGGPIVVRVTDASNNPVPQTAVVVTLNGYFNSTLPCSVATLSGTLTAVTDSTGQAAFSNLSVDRGGYNYTLLASTGSAVQNSGPFSVQGFCASGNLSTQREGHTQDLLGTAKSTFKFPVDPKGAYVFTNTNPAPPGTPDIPDAPLIIPLASIGIKPGDVISGLAVGDMAVCSVGSFCFGEEFTPPVCAAFSTSNTLLPPGTTPSRIPVQDIITPDFTTAFPCQTIPTLFGNLPTDIPQDFFLVGEPVTVPSGAAFLFVAILDSFYTDNSDPNGDFGVQITVNSATSVNGDVLIAGGADNSGNVLNTAELYHPLLGFTSPTGNLTDPNGRANHSSVVLADGRVLLLGGFNNTGAVLATAEIYDPSTGTFSATGSMSGPRFYAAAARLVDGRVLVSGGFNTAVGQNTAEIYDPATGLWTPTGNLNQGRGRHTMTLLPNGKVLVTGGRDGQQNFLALSSAEIFDPFANQGVGAFTAIGNMNSPRHVHTATLLSNGKVLVAGGFNGNNTSSSVGTAEIFDPQTNTFTLTGNLNTPRARQTSTLLPDGTVLEAGGINTFNGVVAAAPAEIYSPATGTFTQTGGMVTGRELPTASLVLPDGNVLVAGGDDGVNELSTTELYYNPIAQAPVVITTTSVPNAFISQPYVQLLQQQNRSGPVTWSVASGTLPPGITFAANGFLTGVPTATGSFTFTVQVTDGISTGTASFTINVSLISLAFTSNAMPAAGSGRAYSQPLPVVGGTLPYNATLTGGTLPPGLALSSSGLITGTPTSAGSFTFSVSVSDSSAPAQSATQTLTMAVDTLSIVTTALPDGMVGAPYSAAITTTGGTLPLSLSSSFVTYTYAGRPYSPNAPTFCNGTYTATCAQHSVRGYFTLASPLPSNLSNFSFMPLQFSFTDGGGAFALTSGQQLPIANFQVSTDANGNIVGWTINLATKTTNCTTNPPNFECLGSFSNPGGQSGDFSAYAFNLNTPLQSFGAGQNSNTPGTWFRSSGSPPGLLMQQPAPNSQSGVLTGTPTLAGHYTFSILAVDSSNPPQTATQTYVMDIFQTGTTAVPATVTFLPFGQPQNSIGGQSLTGSPVRVRVFDATNTPVIGASVAISFDGAPPCSTAVLSGTLTAISNGNGIAVFPNLSIDRGQFGYTLLASAGTASAVSQPFTVEGFCETASLSTPRELGTDIPLQNGKVLLAGGLNDTSNALTTAQIYDPATATVSPTGSLVAPNGRSVHASVLLSDGMVLLVGGEDASRNSLATAELFNPGTGSFSVTGSMAQPRDFPTAVLLTNGKVLVSGGANSNGTLNSAEIYDPSTGLFTATGNLNQARARHTMTLMPDGRVLVAGGRTFNGPPISVLASAEIFDPNANQGAGAFTLIGNMNSPRDEARAVLLGNGKVLVVGGFVSYQTGLSSFTGDVFDPATNTFTLTANMSVARAHPTASVLPDGRVLVTGGVPDISNTTPATTSDDIFDPATNTFTPTGSMTTAREYAKAVILPDGNPLITGGDDGFNTTATQEIFYSTAAQAPISVTTTALANAALGHPYTHILLEQGGLGTLAWTEAGTLPTGMTFSPQGILSGTPTSTGSFPITFTVTDSSTPVKVGSATLTLTVNSSTFSFPAQGLPTAITGVAYSPSLSVSGGTPPVNFAVTSGSLPTGIGLGTNGTFTGTPTATGTFTFTVTATDSSSPPLSASQSFTIQATSPLAITTTSLPNGTVGTTYSFVGVPFNSFTGTSCPPVCNITGSFTVAQPLPPNLNQSIGGSGSFTPISFSFTDGVTTFTNLNTTPSTTGFAVDTDANGNITFYSFFMAGPGQGAGLSVFYDGPSQLTQEGVNLPNYQATFQGLGALGGIWTISSPYTAAITSTGGLQPISFAVTSGALPAGLMLASNGGITGTPTAAGTFIFTITARDTSTPPQFASQVYTIVVGSGAGAPAHVTFVNPPQSSIAGQPMSANPVQVQVTDVNNAVLPGVVVTLAFNGAPACPVAKLNGGSSLAAATDSTGTATFSGPSSVLIDRGHTNYTLTATAGPVVTISNPFNVEGFCPTATPSSTRFGATATLLPNGKVLLAGGEDATVGPVATAELYDPIAGTFTATGNMNSARIYATATLLNDGTVLIAGGTSTPVAPETQPSSALSSAEIYHPSTGAFTALTSTLSSVRVLQSAVLLPDGTVLIAGGFTGGATGFKLNTADLYNPATQTFTALAATMSDNREGFTATLLQSGKVLLAGGFGSSGAARFTADLYDPVAQTFTATSPMVYPHALHTATLLGSGLVAIVGGIGGGGGSPENVVELFNPTSSTFFPATAMLSPTARESHSATLLADGRVLVEGGLDVNFTAQFSSETFDSSFAVSTPGSDMQSARGQFTATLLQNETVLLAGGTAAGAPGSQTLATAPAEIFYPATIIPFSITTASAVASLNVPFRLQLHAVDGVGALTWTVLPPTGSVTGLPPGVTVSPSGVLSGTPTSSGSFTFTLQVTDSATPANNATATFFMFVSAPQLFVDSFLTDANPGVAYSQPIFVSGGTPPYTFTQTGGSLPSGLSLSSNGTVSGTASGSGTFTFTVQVMDSSTPQLSAGQTVKISVAPPLSITTTTLPAGTVGAPYSASVVTTGGLAPISFFAFNLPTGLAMSSSGVISGTPTTSGTFTVEVQASDFSAFLQSAFQIYTIAIVGTPVASMRFVNLSSQFFSSSTINASVQALDATGAPVANTLLSLNVGANPCPAPGVSPATATTDATGTASFLLDVLGGGFGYTLVATSFNGVISTSATFNVAGSCPGATPNGARFAATTTLLNNGQVLVAGGQQFVAGGNAPVATAELYDPVAAKFTLTGGMTVARTLHTATLLSNGNVLLTGGLSQVEPSNLPLASAEIYNPSAGTFTAVGSMSVARFNHSAVALPDGTVLVIGGNNGSGAVSSAEIFNPATGAFTLVPNAMNAAREMATATLLQDATVLIAGGLDMPRTVPPGLSSAEIYDTAAHTFTLTVPMNSGHAGHTATLLTNGKVLIAGGENISALASDGFPNLSIAELYDPSTGTFSLTGQMTSGAALQTATLLQDNKVLLADGDSGFGFTGGGDFQIYDPSTGTFTLAGTVIAGRGSAGAALLGNGTVLIVGGVQFQTFDEIYFPPVYPVVFLTTALPTGTHGTLYSTNVLTTGGFAPVTFAVTGGSLPSGLTLSPQGVLSGTTAATGTFTFSVTATDSSTVPKDSSPPQSATKSLTLAIN